MNRLKSFALLLAFGLLAMAPYAHAAFTATPTQTVSSLTVSYHYTGTPTSDIRVYSWLGVASSTTWIDRNNLLITIGHSSTPVTKDFSVTYNFSALGLTNGTNYVYYLADGTTDQSTVLSGPAYFTVGGTQNPTTPTTGQYAFAATGQFAGQAPGTFQEGFTVKPTTSLAQATTLTLKTFVNTSSTTLVSTDTFPIGPGTGTVSPSTNDLGPGDYTAVIYEGTTSVGSVDFKITSSAPANPSTPPTTPATPPAGPTTPITPAVQVGNTLITYLPGYTITNTDATLPVKISVVVEAQVNLSVYMAPQGQNPSGGQTLVNEFIRPFVPKNTSIKFTGLTAGTTYVFTIKNESTGDHTAPLQFRTTGGTGTTGGSFGVVGTNIVNGIPTDVPALVDTISDKGIVPKCGRTGSDTDTVGTQMCGYKDLMQLIANVIQFGLIMIGPIVAILAMYAGAMIIWLGRLPDPTSEQMKTLKKYKAMLVRAAIGILIIVLAWTLIATILRELGVKSNYILLDILSGN